MSRLTTVQHALKAHQNSNHCTVQCVNFYTKSKGGKELQVSEVIVQCAYINRCSRCSANEVDITRLINTKLGVTNE